jgi:beta-galactosidase
MTPRLFLCVVLLLCGRSAVAEGPRERVLLDFGWLFRMGDAPDTGNQLDYPEFKRLDKTRPDDDAQEASNIPLQVDVAKIDAGKDISFVQPRFDASGWRQVDLPHDWAVELPFDQHGDKSHGYKLLGVPGSNTTIGWYRRSFDLPASDRGRTLWIEFDGVYRNCVVWLNGICLGRNVSGYGSFYFDISQQANYGGKNVLVLRVDASRNEGWFYEGAGIYRHVWLVKTGATHIAHWGTFVTSSLSGTGAAVSIATTVRNDSSQPVSGTLVSTIINSAGEEIAETAPAVFTIAPASEQSLNQTLQVKSPRLWSLDDPYLYTAISRVKTKNKLSDIYQTNFGIRSIKWDANEGFLLNGKHVFIKGTANHQDAPGVGIAVPDTLNIWRLEQLKKFGCNAYRTAHGPATPELLDACDRLGILVFTEQRRIGHTVQSLGDLENLLRRDRNHPSIIAWGICNEELSAQGSDHFAQTLAVPNRDLIHGLDPTRPVTCAMNWDWGNGFSKVLDLQGFNYWFQQTHAKNRGHFLTVDEFHAAFPDKSAFGSEEGSTSSTRGIYENDKIQGYLSAYDRNLPKGGDPQREWGSTAEAWMNFYAARPWLAGAFVWTGFDYRGEPTPYSWPAVSSPTGILDSCGFPKDEYYFYKAWWTTQPVLHILPHWNWQGSEGKNIEVWVYSNYDAVELFLNGQSLGKKEMPRLSHLEWIVPYKPGKLEAKGYRGSVVAATAAVETTNAPVRLALSTDRSSIAADGEDVAVVNVSAVDDHNRFVPTANNLVKFQVLGGTILGVGNGDSSSHEPDKANQRSLFNGLAQVIVQTKQAGRLQLEASADGLEPSTVSLTAAASRASNIVSPEP